MLSLRKVDGKLSRTQVWNVAVIVLTSLFTVAVNMLPQIADAIPHNAFLALALFIKTVDMVLRQITTEPMA